MALKTWNQVGHELLLNGLRASINGHPLIAFFIIACAYSWGFWGLMASVSGRLPFYFPTNWAGSFGPTLAAIIVVVICEGKTGLRGLLRPIWQWRFGVGWYFFILIGCSLPFLFGLGVFILLGGSIALSGEAIVNALVQVFPLYPLVLITGGPLGEEVGWRGYALPHLMRHRTGLVASFVVFLMWLTWHLPLFWLPGSGQYGSSITWYAVTFAAYSVLFTWVYVGTSGSLLSALLLHTTINTTSLFMEGVSPVLVTNPLLLWLYAVAFAALALVVIALNKSMRGRKTS